MEKEKREEKIYNKLSILVYVVLCLAVSGCAAVQPGSPEAVYRDQQEQKRQLKEQAGESVSEAPKWFKELPSDGI